jgi:tRNA(Ile)-lysidine synthase
MSKKNSNVILKNSFKNYGELSNIYDIFNKKLNFLKNKIILVAVSGGPDSLALSALVKAYSYQKKCKIYYVLVDHNLRKGSSNESQSVKKMLKKHKIFLHILKNKILINNNIQSNARDIRYNLLTNFCKKKKIKTILTGHNLEDQVETFFIRLSRGSGLQGLASMKPISKINGNINLIRPLLEFKKNELIKISKLIFGKFYKDPTNKNKKYLRTRVRNLKKILEKTGINYDQIFKSIKNLASSRDTLNSYFNRIYKETINSDNKNKKIVILIKKYNAHNQEMKMKIFQQSIKSLTNSYYSPRSKKILNLINGIKIKKNAKFTLGGCLVVRQNNHLIIKKEKKSSQY